MGSPRGHHTSGQTPPGQRGDVSMSSPWTGHRRRGQRGHEHERAPGSSGCRIWACPHVFLFECPWARRPPPLASSLNREGDKDHPGDNDHQCRVLGNLSRAFQTESEIMTINLERPLRPSCLCRFLRLCMDVGSFLRRKLRLYGTGQARPTSPRCCSENVPQVSSHPWVPTPPLSL